MSASLPDGVARSPVIEFSKLGVMLELMWRGEEAAPKKCTYCQTLNDRAASRCTVCEAALPPAADCETATTVGPASDLAAPAQATSSGGFGGNARRELANTMVWTLAMPLVFFIGFAGWLAFRNPHAPSPSSAVMSPVHAEPRATLFVRAPVPEERPGSVAGDAAAAAGAADAARSADEQSPAAFARPAARPATPSRRAAAPPAKAVAPKFQTLTTPTGSGALASCNGEMFLLRAICINRQCAMPGNAGRPVCVEAIKRRRLDEARRDRLFTG
jgi:hypothetical protein